MAPERGAHDASADQDDVDRVHLLHCHPSILARALTGAGDETDGRHVAVSLARASCPSGGRARRGDASRRATTTSAICTAFSAAPFRRLSLLTNRRGRGPRARTGRRGCGRRTSGPARRPAAGSGRRRARRRVRSARISVGTLGRQRPGELGVHRDRVAGEDRHAHAGAGDEQVGELEDLPALVAELLLLVGLAQAVLDDAAGERHDVEGDRADVLDRLGERHGGCRRA